jgi:hypothetical protein
MEIISYSGITIMRTCHHRHPIRGTQRTRNGIGIPELRLRKETTGLVDAAGVATRGGGRGAALDGAGARCLGAGDGQQHGGASHEGW